MLKLAFAIALTSLAATHSISSPLTRIEAYSSSTSVDTIDIQKSFHQLLKEKLHASKAVITSDVNDSLTEFMDKGAANLHDQNATPEQISNAREVLSDFIDKLISNGDILRGSEGNKVKMISVKTYKQSKKGICPLFPFC